MITTQVVFLMESLQILRMSHHTTTDVPTQQAEDHQSVPEPGTSSALNPPPVRHWSVTGGDVFIFIYHIYHFLMLSLTLLCSAPGAALHVRPAL